MVFNPPVLWKYMLVKREKKIKFLKSKIIVRYHAYPMFSNLILQYLWCIT